MASFSINIDANPTADFKNVEKQITDLYKKVKDPLILKVQLSGQAEEIANLQKQINVLYESLSSGGSSASSGFTAISTGASTAGGSVGELSRRVTEYKQNAAAAASVTSTYKNAMTGVSTTVRAVANEQGVLEVANTKVTETFKSLAQATNEQASAEKKNASDMTAHEKAVKQYYTVLMQLEKAVTNFTAAEHSRNAASRDAYEAIKQEATALRGYEDTANNMSTAAADINARVLKGSRILKQNTATLQANGDATKSLTDRVGGLVAKFSSWLTISQVVMYAVNSVRKMVTASIELDSAMTELKKVTDKTDATYATFLEDASTRAKELGSTLSDIVSATADFARLGYDIDDASTLADVASVYVNVGDDLDSIDDASQSIISTMQAFDVEASDAMSIVDKFNEVSNNYAISSGEIGEALQRSAAAMEAGGSSLDETIALITAANTTVQNADSVGTSLKTVSMYLRAAKTDAEAAGESTDGMANSVSELRSELLQLTNNKVDIQIDED